MRPGVTVLTVALADGAKGGRVTGGGLLGEGQGGVRARGRSQGWRHFRRGLGMAQSWAADSSERVRGAQSWAAASSERVRSAQSWTSASSERIKGQEPEEQQL